MSSLVLSQASTHDRIAQAVTDSQVSPVRGSLHPLARPEFDRGAVSGTLPMERISLFFKPTQAQQEDLNTLLAQQVDPASPNYHKWLTPEQYGSRFGVSQNDLNKVVAWLQSKGLTVVDVPSSRAWVTFSGTASQVSAALHTQIHQFVVNGKSHYANTVEPSVPSAFAGLVLGFRSLNSFRPKPRAVMHSVRPNFTSSISGNHFLAPDDVATIYNLKGLFNSGIDGTGQKMVIVGQTDIVMSDIDAFRSASGLPVNHPQVILVPGSADPGVVTGDIGEADLDLEWAGAVARNASLIYVNSKNVFDSLQHAIAANLAPVISISYGDCEPNFTASDVSALTAMGQQANAQGITIVAATGDSGAADCDFSTSPTTPVTTATHGLAVDLPASMPTVTGMGGTAFNEGSGTFWSSTNNGSNGSALSYIPEIAWNDSALPGGGLAAGGGGKSTLFAKPSWQTGVGVPSDGARDVPDMSMAASPNHDGYLVCSQGNCVNGFRAADSTLLVVGGTSAGAPTFAGIVALINHKANAAQGNVNPVLYALAASTPTAFHDTTGGDNKVPCTAGSKDCPASGFIGFSAGAGYDQASGLGSVDASALAGSWTGPSHADFQIDASSTSVAVTRGATGSVSLTAVALGGFSGTATWTCSVGSALTGVTCSIAANSGNPNAATLTITAPAQGATLRRFRGFGWPESGLFAGVVLIGGLRKRRLVARSGITLALVLAGGLMLGTVACGGGKSTPVQPQTSVSASLAGAVTVQAASGALSHTLPIAVTVN